MFHGRNFQTITKSPIDQVCHMYGSTDHSIKFCPLKALEKKMNNSENEKEIKNDKYIPTNRRMTNQEADHSMKGCLPLWGTYQKKNLGWRVRKSITTCNRTIK